MATVEERIANDGTLSYRARVRVKGKQASRTFARKTDAVEWARDLETDLGRRVRDLDDGKLTLAEAIARYRVQVLPRLKDATKRDRQLAYWERELGSLKLSELSPAVIAAQREKLEARPVRKVVNGLRDWTPTGKRSPASSNRYLAALRALLGVCVREWHVLSRNPARDVKPRREPAGRVRFLDDSERARLLDACAKSDDWRLLPIALLGVYTGARASEVMGLRWRDVVMDRRVVFVHGTKNATSRALPLAPPVLEALRELNRTRRRVGVELIFADAEGRAKFPRKAWERAVRDAGLVDFSFHDTRHTAASYFCMAGASLRELAELLGHKSLAMTQRYSHLATDHLVSVADRMAAAFPADRGAK